MWYYSYQGIRNKLKFKIQYSKKEVGIWISTEWIKIREIKPLDINVFGALYRNQLQLKHNVFVQTETYHHQGSST